MERNLLALLMSALAIFWTVPPVTTAMAAPPRTTGAGAKAVFTPAPAAEPIGDKWAVVIGISRFADPKVPPLKYAAKDARDFCDFLTDPQAGGFQKDHVRLLVNEQATKINIMDMLGDSFLPHAAAPKDLVLIYLSTHGSPSGADIRGVNYVIPYDAQLKRLFATGIEMRQLVRMIKERVHTKRLVLVLDTCYSGAGGQDHKGLVRTNVDSAGLAQGVGSIVISSSAPDQRSWESDELKNSYFTRFLIDSLKAMPDAITIEDAFAKMQNRVQQAVLKDKGEMQTPVIAGSFTGPRLVLGVKPTEVRPAPLTVALADEPEYDSAKSASPGNLASYGEHMRDARKFIAQSKLWDASHSLTAALKANPDSIEAYLVSADVYDRQGRFPEELGAARRAVHSDEESSEAREKLARAYLRVDDPQEALRQAEKAVTLDPENSMGHYWLGHINETALKRVDLAEQEYRKALELNGLNVHALLAMALLLERQGREQSQVEAFVRKALAADEDFAPAREALSRLLLKRGDRKEAEQNLRKAISVSPNNPRLHAELGNVLAESDPQSAEAEYKKGLELGKEVGYCHFAFAKFLFDNRGRVDQAQSEYREAIRLDPELDEAYVRLADLLVKHKKVYDESDDLYRKALAVNPRNVRALLGLARIKMELYRDYPAAEAELKKALTIDPGYSRAHDLLGVLYDSGMNRKFEARKSFEKAIDTDPGNAAAHYHLCMLLLSEKGKNFDANQPLTLARKAAELDSSESSYQTRIGFILANFLKKYKDAEEAYRKAIEINTADSEAHLRLGLLLIEKLGQRKAGESELRTAFAQSPQDPEVKAAFERFVR